MVLPRMVWWHVKQVSLCVASLSCAFGDFGSCTLWQDRHCVVSTAGPGGPLASSAARAQPAMDTASRNAPARHPRAAVVVMRLSPSNALSARQGRLVPDGGGAVQGLPEPFDHLPVE